MHRRDAIAGILAAVGGGAAACRTEKPAGKMTPGKGVPTLDEMRLDAQALGFELSDTELNAVHAYAADFLKAADRVAKAVPPAPTPKYGPRQSARPAASDNPLNAWYVTASIKGAPTGPLAGKQIVIKDNVCVAGLPMMNGSKVMEGFVPDTDATVVARLLDAGAEIMGKSVCESFCMSFGSHTSDTGFVYNPHDHTRTTGGSSSGSAALVATKAVDMAIGCDEGGSIRVPSAFCGIVGIKPTWGLVPFTGIFPLEMTIDHVGPMARSVHDCALMLEVIAGPDGLDPRQNAGLRSQPYTTLMKAGGKGLRVGILKEGFGLPDGEKDVDALVLDAAHRFERSGAVVSSVSIPEHTTLALDCLNLVSAAMSPVAHDAMGLNWKGRHPLDIAGFYVQHRRERAALFPPEVKLWLILERMLDRASNGLYYGRAQNVALNVRAAYDRALEHVDVLAMPTVAARPPKLPPSNVDFAASLKLSDGAALNTPQFDLTGHPALSVPCGALDGLPIGMMLVGRMGDDATVLRAGHTFEQLA
ncbi:MAG TPA: amidase [Bryobacteraceae bacterium]|nr:amidase [Bryobacteraceae bacterium]